MIDFKPVIGENIRKVIVWDLDDTVFATEIALTDFINNVLGVPLIWKNRLDKTCPVEGPLLMAALDAGTFMAYGNFVDGFNLLPGLLKHLETTYPEVLNIFVTHRGYHPLAAERTETQFKRLGVTLKGIFLDPDKDPCKKTWLDNNLEGLPWILFDDNPKWGGGVEGSVDNVYLMDKLWNQKETAYQRVYDINGVIDKIGSFVES